ncbi:hypothetical protein [Microbacterium sp. VKM Ac-2923]|uniref:hypothetical protein n=1 Tax=Microbacterium sp. VKM Ac-2923 TaxID=2929476 RepID=UPI001FB41B2D|nr:hypothetical protein [Microbacterium sp. VKM Ac-2923]MCJ1707884.1 hypothetical protein [Microbacterium sp. VKM Ac-2923]
MDEPGRWWLSLVYIAVILVAAVGAVLAPLTVFFVGSPTEGLPGIVATGGIVGGMSALVWVCLRAPAVRNRLRPGAVSISASAATFIAVGWTFLAVSGTHSYRDSDDAFWARLPFALAACVPVLVVAVCALTISRFIQRDDARRAAAARHSREVASGTGRLRG